jgi:hypothetical protein
MLLKADPKPGQRNLFYSNVSAIMQIYGVSHAIAQLMDVVLSLHDDGVHICVPLCNPSIDISSLQDNTPCLRCS